MSKIVTVVIDALVALESSPEGLSNGLPPPLSLFRVGAMLADSVGLATVDVSIRRPVLVEACVEDEDVIEDEGVIEAEEVMEALMLCVDVALLLSLEDAAVDVVGESVVFKVLVGKSVL
jgi:hypothetical protein